MITQQKKLDSVRKKIEQLEKSIGKQKAALAKLRTKAPLEPVQNYTLLSARGKPIQLSALFGKRNELILIHNMGVSCPYCTLWADGFNGLTHHLENRAAFVLESPDSPKTVSAFQKKRGWNFNVVSSQKSTFRKDMGYTDKEGDPMPGISTFIKKGGKIFRVADTGFGPGDNYCVMWDICDLLPASDWGPQFKY